MKHTESSLAKYIKDEGINETNWREIKISFQEIWSYDRIKSMTLEEYNDLKENFEDDKYCFTYWIERHLEGLGRLGSNSKTFRVYKTREGSYDYNLSSFSDKYGAFEYTKANILKIIDLVNKKEIQSIQGVDLANNFKWKIAFLYDNSDFVIPIYSLNMINRIPGLERVKTNYDAYSEIAARFYDSNPYITHYKLLDQLDELDYKGTDTIFIPIKYHLNKLTNENIFDSIEESIQRHGRILWGLSLDNLFEAVSNIRYIFFISSLDDKSLILYKANVVNYSRNSCEEAFNKGDYKKGEELKVGIEIDKIEPVTLSYIDYFIEVTTHQNLRYRIESLMKKECIYLMRNENISKIADKYDLSSFDKPGIFSKVDKLMGIHIHDYEGLRDIFLNFSELSLNFEDHQNFSGNRSPFNCNTKISNIFQEEGIDGLRCILGKNGVGKSRILKLFCRYLYEWQSNVNTKDSLDIYGKSCVEFYFQDNYGNIIRTGLGDYIGEKVETVNSNYGKVILDFSQIRHTFIANTLTGAKDFPRNVFFYRQEYGISRNLTYSYAGIERITPGYRRQDSNDNLYLLFLILIDPELRKTLDEISEQAKLNFIFSQVRFSLKNGVVPKKAKITSLLELLTYIRDLDEGASFFQENKNRLKLAKILEQSDGWISAGTRYTSQIKEVDELMLQGIHLKEGSPYFEFFKKIEFNDTLPLEYITNTGMYLEGSPIHNNTNLLLRQLWFLLFNSNLIELDLIGDNDKGLGVLSTGEFTLLLTIVKSLLSIDQLSQKTTYLIFDEPDLSLHPEWQRRFIDILTIIIRKINTIRTQSERQKIYIILTTHSPIIVSDIPRDNIIGLELKGGEVKISGLEQESFLNDIYSNLSSSFFMEQNIGAYSYKKLKSAIESKDGDFAKLIGDTIIKNSFIHKIQDKGDK